MKNKDENGDRSHKPFYNLSSPFSSVETEKGFELPFESFIMVNLITTPKNNNYY